MQSKELVSFEQMITYSEEFTSHSESTNVRETITTHETQSTKYEVVEESHQMYYNILVRKSKVDISKNEAVFNHIALNSLERIFRFQKRTVATSMEYIAFGIISIEEVVETTSMTMIQSRSRHKVLGSYLSVVYGYAYRNDPARRMVRNSLMMDFLDRIDYELVKSKRKKEVEDGSIAKVETRDRGEIKKKPTKRRARLPESGEKGPGQEDEELLITEDYISRSPQKSPVKARAEEVIVEVKEDEIKEFEGFKLVEEKKTVAETVIVNEEDKAIKTKTKEVKVKASKPKEDPKPKPKPEIQEKPQEEEKPPKKKAPKKRTPDTGDKPSEPHDNEDKEKRIKKKVVVVKKVIKKKKAETITSGPFIATGGGSSGGMAYNTTSNPRHCINEKCVVCKGLPVRPHICTGCNRQYCNMCTYDLPNSSKCSDCKGGLIAMTQNATTTFEATITKFSPQKPDEKFTVPQASSKDFYEQHRDRYRTKLWDNDDEDAIKRKEADQDNESMDNHNGDYEDRGDINDDIERRDYEREQMINNDSNISQDKKQVTPTKHQHKIIRDKEITNTMTTMTGKTSKQYTDYHKGEDSIDWGKYYYIKKYAFGLTVQKSMPLPLNDPVWSCIYIPEISKGTDGILTGHSSGTVYLWSIDKGLKMKSFNAHTAKVFDIKILPMREAPNKVFFITVSEDRFIKLWDISCINPLLSFGLLSSIYTVDSLSNCFIVGDKNKSLSYYSLVYQNSELAKESSFLHTTEHINFIWRVLILKKIKQSNYVISAGEKSLQLHQFDKEERRFVHIRDYEGHGKLIHSITEMIQGLFATTSADHSIRIWNYEEDTCQKVMDSYYNDCVFSLIYLNEYVEKIPKTSNVFICGGFDKKMKLIGDEPSEEKTREYASYDRPEALYRMIYLSNNAKYKIASINYGVSSNLFIWGANSLE